MPPQNLETAATTNVVTALKDTLQLPRTDFAMRGNLAAREPQQLAHWDKLQLRQKIAAARLGGPKFVLHDGPPYANGALHHGHVLNKVLKDFVVKDRTMRGYDVSFVPGWDCHGLPIENQVDKALKGKARQMSAVAVHEACSAYAAEHVVRQAEGFARLGVFADWQAPYRTMDFVYEAQIVREFGRLVGTHCVYRGLRPVHWCAVHQTALAEAEVEYESKRSASIYVAMRLEAAAKGPLTELMGPVDLVIWTTTPWSLPGNVAIAVHPEATYLVARCGPRHVVVAEALWEAFVAATKGAANAANIEQVPQVSLRLRGEALDGLRYAHPFLPRHGVVVADDFVALDTGTGAVHSAPAHGAEDFELALRRKLDIFCPVDAAGVLTDAAGPFAGLSLDAASRAIVTHLEQSGALLNPAGASITHRYAHCGRCHKPLITRATQQWFLALDKPLAQSGATLRQKALAALDTVAWVPKGGIERIRGMLQARPDWCLSRQRIWGVPVPVAYCSRCDTPLLDQGVIERIAQVMANKGARAWYTENAAALFGEAACTQCGHQVFRQENDILDVWFDSGTSHAAVLEALGIGHATGPAADLYLEGSDQHRGWFHSSLLTAVATRGHAPYREVLTHGFVVDGAGKKLSKSSGNAADPFVAVKKDGAELFRLWVACENYQEDVRLSPVIMRQVAEHYRKLRNTLRYLLGNLHGFCPNTDAVAARELLAIDRYMLTRHQELVGSVQKAYLAHQYHTGMQQLLTYCGGELSAFYLDVLKDRLYAEAPKSTARLAAQSVLYVIARDLTRLLAPILPFTADEAWQHLPRHAQDAPSVHMMRYPAAAGAPSAAPVKEPDFVAAWASAVASAPGDGSMAQPNFAQLLVLRGICNAALEQARRDKHIGASTEAALQLRVGAKLADAVAALPQGQLCDLLIVSEVEVTQAADVDFAEVTVGKARGHKCARCWLYRPEVAELSQAPQERQRLCNRCTEVLAC